MLLQFLKLLAKQARRKEVSSSGTEVIFVKIWRHEVDSGFLYLV